MTTEGTMIHGECNGTGFKETEDGSIDVCVKCMGSGMTHVDIEIGDHPRWLMIKE